MPGKRIGFVDLCLDNFHADVYLEAFRGPLAERGYHVAGATGLDRAASRAWAGDNRVVYFDDVEQLDRHVDCFMILAPSNPEVHLQLCERVLPLKKTTFVDKPFADNLASAAAIFALADEHGVAIQSTSALRNTAVQRVARESATPVDHLAVWAGGSSWEEYGIHPIELVVSCLGPDVTALSREGADDHPRITLRYADGRVATIDFNAVSDVGFQAVASTAGEVHTVRIDSGRLFEDAAAAILDFFDADAPQFDRRETLMIRNILDVAMSDAANRRFVDLQ